MNRKILVGALFIAAVAMVVAQSSQSPYAGTSNPPPDDTITDSAPPQPAPKPPAAHYATPAQPAATQPAITQPGPAQPAIVQPALVQPAPQQDSSYVTGNDDGIVQVASEPSPSAQPQLNQRTAANNPDGDIVHPAALPPGELGDGTEIRARLLGRLSTAMNQPGDPFHARVASDVYRGSQILIPTGSEIDGTVVEVSSGRTGGHGSMLLRPETVVLPDGSRHRLYAQTMGAPGSRTRVGSEGEISPDSRMKKDSMEYGGAVGAGAITGAVVAGPVGALAGTLIGAGAITVHLLVNHPQADLEPGTVLLFSLTEPLDLAPAERLPAQLPAEQPAAQPIASN
ncbi:MAG TPA: hypothetical protein VHX20_00300 [Terracidiphilus sp.]|jgi:hypothetical protein|nr:hypothetical protein [Terracidiphilus sp.]